MNEERKADSDISLKLLLIGNAFVGKTLIVQKFIDNSFSKNTVNTIGVDLQSKTIDIGDKKVKFLIWDTAGEDRMKSMTFSYYRGCHAILIVFDLTDIKSFNNVSNWVDCINKFAKPNVIRILVGNKKDLVDQRKVTNEQARKLAGEYKIKYFEISAKQFEGVQEMFEDVGRDYVETHAQKSTFQIKNVYETNNKNKKKCCQ